MLTKYLRNFIICYLLAVPLIAQGSDEGDTTVYPFVDFDKIDVTGNWDIKLQQGDRFELEATAVTDSQKVWQDGDTIYLNNKKKRRLIGKKAEIRIQLPLLLKLHIAGQVVLGLSGFQQQEKFNIKLEGSTKLSADKSRFEQLTISSSGNLNLDFQEALTEEVELHLRGKSEVLLQMTGGKLSGKLEGSNRVLYSGTVSSFSIDSSGWSAVKLK